jgi:hypothetical protein
MGGGSLGMSPCPSPTYVNFYLAVSLPKRLLVDGRFSVSNLNW